MVGPFDIGRWRSIVNYAVTDVSLALDIPVEAICPFGFEVFRDQRFLFKTLRRFYCYLGSEGIDPQTAARIEGLFADALYVRLDQEWQELASEIIVYKTSSSIRRQMRDIPYSKNDRMVSVLCLSTDDILLDYAKYIICAVDAIFNETLPQVKHFSQDQVARNRVFQIYLMEEALFSSLISPLASEEQQLQKRLFSQDNRIEFVLRKELSPLASKVERSILRNLILKRLNQMRNAMRGNNSANRETICSPVFHGEGEISMEISKSIYINAIDSLCSSYIEFEYLDCTSKPQQSQRSGSS